MKVAKGPTSNLDAYQPLGQKGDQYAYHPANHGTDARRGRHGQTRSMTEVTASIPALLSTSRPAPRRTNAATQWLPPVGLIALSLIPIVAGAVRLTELTGGAEITANNAPCTGDDPFRSADRRLPPSSRRNNRVAESHGDLEFRVDARRGLVVEEIGRGHAEKIGQGFQVALGRVVPQARAQMPRKPTPTPPHAQPLAAQWRKSSSRAALLCLMPGLELVPSQGSRYGTGLG
jgi:hypothetical protein